MGLFFFYCLFYVVVSVWSWLYFGYGAEIWRCIASVFWTIRTWSIGKSKMWVKWNSVKDCISMINQQPEWKNETIFWLKKVSGGWLLLSCHYRAHHIEVKPLILQKPLCDLSISVIKSGVQRAFFKNIPLSTDWNLLTALIRDDLNKSVEVLLHKWKSDWLRFVTVVDKACCHYTSPHKAG